MQPGTMWHLLRAGLLTAVISASLVWPAYAGGEQLLAVFTGREISSPAGRVTPAGFTDYLEMLNRRDGGINGVRLNWEECETAFDDKRGVECFDRLSARGVTALLPLSSGISYALSEASRRRRIPMLMVGYGRADAADGRAFPYAFALVAHLLSQAAAQIAFIGSSEGGIDRLRGKRVAYLYLDIPTGREALDVLQILADRNGFELSRFAVPLPGTDLRASWDEIRRQAPDWVLLAGPGPMTPAALQAAALVGFPARRIVGFGLSGDEQDVLPAGKAAIGYVAAALNPSGVNFAVLRDIAKHLRAAGRRDTGSTPREFGSASYNRGVIQGILIAEAVRVAQRRFGARPLSGEQMQWGLERLALDEARLAQLGALELLQPLTLSCRDHEGGGAVKFQQWLGTRWNVITDWVHGDIVLVRQLVEAFAQRYAHANGFAMRSCRED